LSLGADGIELDVHLSRDGEVVIHHDPTLERTTNGRGNITDHTADELARLDAAFWFRAEDRPGGRLPPVRTAEFTPEMFPFRGRGIGIPRLRDVLARYPNARVIIELKMNSTTLAERTVDLVRRADAVERVAIGSFYSAPLRRVREYEPRIRTGAAREETRWALYRSYVWWPLIRPAYAELQVPESSGGTTIVTPRFVAHAHRAKIPVKVWTVNAPEDMTRLLSWGVDALISDRPDLAVAAVASPR
jgi:glycerophosphoryl diester phosphodiesterase